MRRRKQLGSNFFSSRARCTTHCQPRCQHLEMQATKAVAYYAAMPEISWIVEERTSPLFGSIENLHITASNEDWLKLSSHLLCSFYLSTFPCLTLVPSPVQARSQLPS
jgi:hypothetical protein